MSAIDKTIFLKEYSNALRECEAALFVGAGVSHAAGYVDWKRLLKSVAEELGLDVDRESDLVALAQFHVNQRGGRGQLNQLLINEFIENAELTQSHTLVASLPVRTVWTTNYDDLLEVAFQSVGKRIDVKRRPADFATTRRRTDVTIYKMHGDKNAPDEAVLTKEDYETYHSKREIFAIAFKGDLARKTFLFVGFGFTDPNIGYLLSQVRQLLETNGRQHYCLVKPPDPKACGDYLCKRFDHWLVDLSRYSIQPVLLDTYDDVPQLLGELNRRSHLRDVFISGSAADFSPLGEEKFREFCRLLGHRLIEKRLNIVSGFGLGVGDNVIVGAMQALGRNDDDRLQLWPFPQTVPEDVDRAAFWRDYREQMISRCGVCIILAGNKKTDAAIVPADGVRQEVDIARSQGKIVIPVGATGHVAEEVWKQVAGEPTTAYGPVDVRAQLEVLGNASASPEALVEAVIDIIRILDK